jgi:hypothetical protein
VPVKDFNVVSQLGHFAGGVAVVAISTVMVPTRYRLTAALYAFVAVLVLIGIKEAFIDPRTESVIVAGSGLEDWALWMLGAIVALALVYVRVTWLYR